MLYGLIQKHYLGLKVWFFGKFVFKEIICQGHQDHQAHQGHQARQKEYSCPPLSAADIQTMELDRWRGIVCDAKKVPFPEALLHGRGPEMVGFVTGILASAPTQVGCYLPSRGDIARELLWFARIDPGTIPVHVFEPTTSLPTPSPPVPEASPVAVRPIYLPAEENFLYSRGFFERFQEGLREPLPPKATEFLSSGELPRARASVDAIHELGFESEFDVDILHRDPSKRPPSDTQTANLVCICPCTLLADRSAKIQDILYLREKILPGLFDLGNRKVMPRGHLVVVLMATPDYILGTRISDTAEAKGWQLNPHLSELLNIQQLQVESNGRYVHFNSDGKRPVKGDGFVRFVFEKR